LALFIAVSCMFAATTVKLGVRLLARCVEALSGVILIVLFQADIASRFGGGKDRHDWVWKEGLPLTLKSVVYSTGIKRERERVRRADAGRRGRVGELSS
jgi:hypothetical protein